MRVQTEVILKSGDGPLDEYLVTISGEVIEQSDGQELVPHTIRIEEAREVDTLTEVPVLEVTDLLAERLRLEERNSPRYPCTIREALEDAAYEQGARHEKFDGVVVEEFGDKVRICAIGGPNAYYRVSWSIGRDLWTVGFYANTLKQARVLAAKKAAEFPSLRLVQQLTAVRNG